MKPRVKICGINSLEAAEAAARGADYLGFILAPESVRAVSAERAAELAGRVRGRARTMGVFTRAGVEEILAAARAAGFDGVQLHGAYGEKAVGRLKAEGLEVWLLDGEGAEGTAADAVLVDGRKDGASGGTGTVADWGRVGKLRAAGRRVVLAGGIGAENFAAAAATGAEVIDVNSSLEEVKGVKSVERIAAFLESIQ